MDKLSESIIAIGIILVGVLIYFERDPVYLFFETITLSVGIWVLIFEGKSFGEFIKRIINKKG